MYGKIIPGGERMWFLYAPPMTNWDEASLDRPTPPYRGAPKEECSVYYYWWAFLRENEDYMACCTKGGKGRFGKLHADFGDLRRNDFFWWWKRQGRELFCEPPAREVVQITSIKEYRQDADTVLLAIPLDTDLDVVTRQMRELVKPLRQRKTTGHLVSRAKYPVHTKPVLTSLHQTLTVWRVRKTHPELTLHEVADMTKLQAAKAKDKDDVARRLKSTAVSRCLKAARHLIHNVGEGRFPDVSTPK